MRVYVCLAVSLYQHFNDRWIARRSWFYRVKDNETNKKCTTVECRVNHRLCKDLPQTGYSPVCSSTDLLCPLHHRIWGLYCVMPEYRVQICAVDISNMFRKNTLGLYRVVISLQTWIVCKEITKIWRGRVSRMHWMFDPGRQSPIITIGNLKKLNTFWPLIIMLQSINN